jgi:hypothetical protein
VREEKEKDLSSNEERKCRSLIILITFCGSTVSIACCRAICTINQAVSKLLYLHKSNSSKSDELMVPEDVTTYVYICIVPEKEGVTCVNLVRRRIMFPRRYRREGGALQQLWC